jgi:outer membrane protein TolC
MKQVARQEAESRKQSYNSLKNYLISQVKQNYYDLWYWQEALQITTRNKSLLQDLSKNASVRYSVGEGIQQDVLQAQIELTDLLHDEVMIAEQIKSSRAKLNILLNKNPQESLSVTEEIGLVDLKRSESELQQMAMESSPLLAEVKAMSATTKAEYQLAKREYWPSLELGGTYMIRQRVMDDPLRGEDLLSFRLSMNLPLYFWSRQSKKVAQTSLQWQSSQREYEGKVNQIKLEISRLYYELESLKERLRLHNDLLGLQAHQSLDAARAAYQVNKVDFATVLKSYQAVYEYETEFNRLFASYMKTRAELESVVGRPLE